MKILFLLLLIFPFEGIFCQVEPISSSGRLTQEYKATDSDSLKIEKLFDIAFYYFDYLGDNKAADSISEMAIRIAEKSHQPELLHLACHKYVECNDLHEYYQKALDYALKAGESPYVVTNQEYAFQNYKNLASVYLSGYEFDKALEYSYKLLSIAGSTDNSALKAESYLLIGQCLEGKNQKIEAFRNYLNATSLADRINNMELRCECYSRLSNFYNFVRFASD
ncbi:MAG: hypothetical protein NTW16_02485 [Bacteroidetes bacterium]|nr:hypothetical protein [Bacteroidota bacterium]